MTHSELLNAIADRWETDHNSASGFGFGNGEALGCYRAWSAAVAELRLLAQAGDAVLNQDPQWINQWLRYASGRSDTPPPS